MSTRSGFFVHDHNLKARLFREALKRAGLEEKKTAKEAEVILTDSDAGNRSRRLVNENRDALIFMYPHSARPHYWKDGLFETCDDSLTAVFTITEAHAEIMRLAGYALPIHPVGWTFCDQREFVPCPEPKHVLFMPIHPSAAGFLSGHHKELNARVFSRLLRLLNNNKIQKLTVRYLTGLPQNGIYFVPSVDYVKGKPDQSTTEIDAADVVVATHTAAAIAVARGKPTAMIAEGDVPMAGNSTEAMRSVAHWERYSHLVKYPLDILDGDPLEVLKEAGWGSEAVDEWRRRLIGEPFSEEVFIEKIRHYLGTRGERHG